MYVYKYKYIGTGRSRRGSVHQMAQKMKQLSPKVNARGQTIQAIEVDTDKTHSENQSTNEHSNPLQNSSSKSSFFSRSRSKSAVDDSNTNVTTSQNFRR